MHTFRIPFRTYTDTLTGVSVNVKIFDFLAEVTIEQRYVNRENTPIEAVYKFPLDEGNMTMEIVFYRTYAIISRLCRSGCLSLYG